MTDTKDIRPDWFTVFYMLVLGFVIGWMLTANVLPVNMDRTLCVEFSQVTGECARDVTVGDLLKEAQRP